MNILITGGAGSIGSTIVRFHLERGDRVCVLDDLSTGRKENLLPFLKNPHFQFVEQDVSIVSPQLTEAIRFADRIYHMAATVGQRIALFHPVEVLSKNISAVNWILHTMAEEKSSARLAIASSSSVYGYDIVSEKPDQEDVSLRILSGKCVQESYKLSKIVNETTVLSYIHQKGLHAVVPRIFNTIGPNQVGTYGMVAPTLIEQALKGLPLTVYGNGKQTRSFCNVKDTVMALHLLLETPACKGEIVNVGTDEEISILALANLIIEMTKSSSTIQLIPYKEAYGIEFQDTLKRVPDLNKLQRLVQFRPRFSLRETLQEMIEQQKRNPR